MTVTNERLNEEAVVSAFSRYGAHNHERQTYLKTLVFMESIVIITAGLQSQK